MKINTSLVASSLLLAVPMHCLADTVTLRNGAKLEGTFVGGSAQKVQIVDSKGKTLTIAVGDVASMSFSAPPPAPPPPKASGKAVQLPAGTPINVRLVDGIDVDAATSGQVYRATIDDPILMGGATVVPRGAEVALQAAAVKQAGRFKGSDEISLKVNSITVNGKKFDVVTEAVAQKGGSEGKKTARRTIGVAGLGAAIGGIAGGGEAAAIGALAGAGAGAAASAGGQSLKIPAETRLQFKLSSAVNIQ